MSLRDYLEVLRRQKWLLLFVVVTATAAAVVYSLQQAPVYRAGADVLLSRQDVAAALSGVPDTTATQDADRVARTQSQLARVPAVGRAAIAAAGVPISLDRFFDQSSVSTSPNSDLLKFEVEHRTRSGAERLVNAYARAFARYREALDTVSLRRARRGVVQRLRRIRDRDSALYRSLSVKDEELRVQLALQTSHAAVVKTADNAAQVGPKPVRNGLLALVLAILLGAGLAFLRDTLDTGVRTAPDIAGRLRLPLLARLPRPARHLRKSNRIVMLAQPRSPAAEAFRILRTNLELANVEEGARTIMVASAYQEEGKSTTIANLAVAVARAGRHVVVVDLDLRRGDIDRLFGVENRLGITDIAFGGVDVQHALVPVDVNPDPDDAALLMPTAHDQYGRLEILPAGQFMADAGDFVVSESVADILAQLADMADFVLIDAPPFLQTSDALAITARVDAVVVVTKLGVRRQTLDELSRTLEQSSARLLGVVVTDDEFEPRYGTYGSKPDGNGTLLGRRFPSRATPGRKSP